MRVCTLSFVALYFYLSPGLTHNQEDVSIPELGWERCVWCRRRGLRIRTLLEVLWLNRTKACENSKKHVMTQLGCYKWRIRWVPALWRVGPHHARTREAGGWKKVQMHLAWRDSYYAFCAELHQANFECLDVFYVWREVNNILFHNNMRLFLDCINV